MIARRFSASRSRVARRRLQFDFLETFSALDELLLALDVFQNLSNIPVVTSLAVSEEGRLDSGESFAEAVKS